MNGHNYDVWHPAQDSRDRPLPNLVKTSNKNQLELNLIQAITTSYRFNCCRAVTEWRALVEKRNPRLSWCFTPLPSKCGDQTPTHAPVETGGGYNLTGLTPKMEIWHCWDKTSDWGTTIESERIEVQSCRICGPVLYLLSNNGWWWYSVCWQQEQWPLNYVNKAVWCATDELPTGPPNMPISSWPRTYTQLFINLALFITAAVCECMLTTSSLVTVTKSLLKLQLQLSVPKLQWWQQQSAHPLLRLFHTPLIMIYSTKISPMQHTHQQQNPT